MLNYRHLALMLAAMIVMTLTLARDAGATGPLRDISREMGLGSVEATGAMRVDFDGDGVLDLFLSAEKGLTLYRNIPKSRFGRETIGFEDAGIPVGLLESEGNAAAWGDFDGDGDLDLFVTNRYRSSHLFRNDGGAFVDVAGSMGVERGGGLAAAWGDFDGDGDLDLAVGRVGPLLLYRNDGSTGLTTGRTAFAEVAVAAGLPAVTLVSDVSWVDFDGDGRVDLFCAGPRSVNRLYRNTGREGRFVDAAPEMGVAESHTTRLGVWGDFDNDGDLDLYLVNGQGPNRLLRNDGSRFTDVAARMGVDDDGSGVGATWVDFDSDGDLDLHLVNLLGPDRLFRNDGRQFVDVSQTLGIGQGEVVNAAWGDFDGDGVPDLFEARIGTPALYRGAADGNASLTVRVAGPAGARVTVTSGGTRQVREVYDGLTLFGLGPQAGDAEVAVTWPDGRRRTLRSLAGSRTLRVAPDDRLPEMAVETDRIAFGEAERPVESIVAIANRGAAPMTLRTAHTNHAAFHVRTELPLTVPPGGSIRLPVRFAPGQPGPQTGTLTLQTDDPWRGQQPILLTATAAVPDLDLSSERLAFEATPLGKSSSSSVTVFNRGIRPLTLSTLSVDGPFKVETALPLTVPEGASVPIPVIFRPAGVGQATGSLTLVTDDPDRPKTPIALSGRGRGTPIARPSVSELDFGGTPLGSARSLRLTLSNSGDDDLNVSRVSVAESEKRKVEGEGQKDDNASAFRLHPSNDSPDRSTTLPSVFEFVLPAGQSRDVEVRFRPTRRGDVQAMLSLTTDDPTRPTLTVPLKGRGTAPKARLPVASIDFGEVGVDKTVELPVVLFNDGDADLLVSQIVSESPLFTLSTDTLTVPSGASRPLTVAYKPYRLQAVIRRITLTTNDPDRPQIDLRVSGTGIPRRPSVRLVPAPSTGEVVRVAVHIDDAPALTGYFVTLRFDPALLRFESISTKADGGTGILGANALDAPPLVQDGAVTFGSARPSSAGSVVDGKGLLGVLTFRPTEGLTPERQTILQVEKVFLRGPGGNAEIAGPVVLTIHGGERKALRGDINGDGKVDLNDFFALSEGFGKRSGDPGFDRRLDLNEDGRIDLEDLFILQDAMRRK